MSTYCSQIAFVCRDAKSLRAWYCNLFGFVLSGRTIYAGKLSTRVMGIEGVNTRCYWCLDGNESMFQLEFFDFRFPQSLPRPDNWIPAMPGYTSLGIHVRNFQLCVDQLYEEGRLKSIEGKGGSRIAFASDPEGNLIEVYERDPLHGAGWSGRLQTSAVRLIRLNTHDAQKVERCWSESLGLVTVDMSPEWTQRRSIRENGLSDPRYLRGGGVVVEICRTGEPFPAGKCAPLHQQGFMNFAINTESRLEWDRVYNRALQAGFSANGKALEAGIFKVMYITDPEGNSIELLFPRKFAYRLTGFKPSFSLGSTIRSFWKSLFRPAG